MKFVHIFLIAIILLSSNFLKADDVKTENKIAKNLRCLICQGQSVYDSDSEFAISLKLVIKNKIQQGMSEEQIYSFVKIKYGEWILYEPEFNKNTYFLWLLPILMFIFGGAIIFKLFIIKKN
tara:strand:+ start:74 stop:439 length:366 start_codon:yes stop_codon:yes gene_type:complete